MHLAGVVGLQEFVLKQGIGVGPLIMMVFFSFTKNVHRQAAMMKPKTQHYVDMFHQQQLVQHLVAVILLGLLVKFFTVWVEKEQGPELAPEQIVQHILKRTQSHAAHPIVGLGVLGPLYFLEFKTGQELVLEQTVAHIQIQKADVEHKAQQHVEPVAENHLLEKLARLRR
jgi:hypothetical protein